MLSPPYFFTSLNTIHQYIPKEYNKVDFPHGEVHFISETQRVK